MEEVCRNEKIDPKSLLQNINILGKFLPLDLMVMYAEDVPIYEVDTRFTREFDLKTSRNLRVVFKPAQFFEFGASIGAV